MTERLSKNFTAAEFVSPDGEYHPIDPKLIEMLQALRDHFNEPVYITSGYRSPQYNAHIGGAQNSYHLRGMAADFQMKTVSPESAYLWLDSHYEDCGLGLYRSHTHLDCRGHKARWTKT